MRYAAVALLIAALTTPAVRAQSPARAPTALEVKLSSMLAGAVTFTLPAGWHVSMYINTATNGSAEIINTEKVGDKPQARLFLSARFVPEGKTVVDVSGDTYGTKLRKVLGGTVLSDRADGQDWRTVIWTADVHREPHLMLEHFGVVDNTYASATVVMPLGLGDVGRMKKVFEDFNAVCESLKVNGRGNFENRVSPDIIKEQLKVNARK